jgi:hypothetical protein
MRLSLKIPETPGLSKYPRFILLALTTGGENRIRNASGLFTIRNRIRIRNAEAPLSNFAGWLGWLGWGLGWGWCCPPQFADMAAKGELRRNTGCSSKSPRHAAVERRAVVCPWDAGSGRLGRGPQALWRRPPAPASWAAGERRGRLNVSARGDCGECIGHT